MTLARNCGESFSHEREGEYFDRLLMDRDTLTPFCPAEGPVAVPEKVSSFWLLY